jgi:DNA-binding NarL/FixJ family response regulator
MNGPVGREALPLPITTRRLASQQVGICISSRITRLRIQKLINDFSDVAFAVETVEELLQSTDECVDLLIIDCLILHQLNDRHNRLRHLAGAVLVVGDNYEDWPREFEFSLQSGTQGYCRHDANAMQLQAAVSSLLTRGTWFDRDALELLRKRLITQECSHDSVPPFTKRESAVLDRIVKGMTNRQIAAELFVSVPTVKSHVREIFIKLNVRNRAQASSEAVRRALAGH